MTSYSNWFIRARLKTRQLLLLQVLAEEGNRSDSRTALLAAVEHLSNTVDPDHPSLKLARELAGEARFPFASPGAISRAQRRRLLAMVRHAYRTVPHYRDVMDRLGFTMERLREINPRLIVAQTSGYGNVVLVCLRRCGCRLRAERDGQHGGGRQAQTDRCAGHVMSSSV